MKLNYQLDWLKKKHDRIRKQYIPVISHLFSITQTSLTSNCFKRCPSAGSKAIRHETFF